MANYYIETVGNSQIWAADESASEAAENGSVTSWAVGDAFVLITQLYFSDACNKAVDSTGLKLQFSKDGGGFSDVGAATEISYTENTTLVDEASSTDRSLSDPSAGGCGSGWTSGIECTDAATALAISSKEYYSEVQWALDTGNASAGSTYTFQVYDTTNNQVVPNGSVQTDIAMAAQAQTYYQDAGQGAMSIAGGLKKKTTKEVGGYAVSIAGTLAKFKKSFVAAGGHAMAIAGSLKRKTSKVAGQHAMAITGALKKKTMTDAGGHAMTITGSLSSVFKSFTAVGGGSVAIAGALASAGKFKRNIGAGSVIIAGSLKKKTSKTMGEGAMTIAGTLVKKTLKPVGSGSVISTGDVTSQSVLQSTVGQGVVTITGTLSSIGKFGRNVGGAAVTITGGLVKKTSKGVGGGVINIAGNAGKVVRAVVGEGAVILTGALTAIYSGGEEETGRKSKWLLFLRKKR